MVKRLDAYKNGEVWLFDDEEKHIEREPFVEGSSCLISEIQRRNGLSGDTLSITFSDEPLDHDMHELIWKDSRDDDSWNQYYSPILDMYGWLCPVLLVYFDEAPRKLYVSLM